MVPEQRFTAGCKEAEGRLRVYQVGGYSMPKYQCIISEFDALQFIFDKLCACCYEHSISSNVSD